MIKRTVESIYIGIFLLSIILYIFSVWRYITSTHKEWFSFALSLCIMLLSFWGYLIVRKYLK